MMIDIDVPDGELGPYQVSTFTVDERQSSLDLIRSGSRYVPPGTYKKLTRDGYVIMSNTPAEIRDHLKFIHIARGHVLINGLGLGVALKVILDKDDVKSVTIIEISPYVINLVGPTYIKYPRIEIIQADAFKYRPAPDMRYDAVWHDIWDDISPDNIAEMDLLQRRYRKRADWQGSWCRGECLRLRREDRRRRYGSY